MVKRLILQSKFEEIPEVKKVYYQPPASIRMVFPCIVYSPGRPSIMHADNKSYLARDMYTVTVIDKNPDSKIPGYLVDEFKYCQMDRSFVSDGLHHTVFTLYF